MPGPKFRLGSESEEARQKVCINSQSAWHPSCSVWTLEAAPRCHRRCERRWAGCALHFNYHLCANIRQHMASFMGNQCFLVFSPVCNNTSKAFTCIYCREDVQMCSRQCRCIVVPIIIIQCQESTIPTLLFFSNPHFRMIRLILLTQAKTTNPCSGLPFCAAVAMQYGHPLKIISLL